MSFAEKIDATRKAVVALLKLLLWLLLAGLVAMAALLALGHPAAEKIWDTINFRAAKVEEKTKGTTDVLERMSKRAGKIQKNLNQPTEGREGEEKDISGGAEPGAASDSGKAAEGAAGHK